MKLNKDIISTIVPQIEIKTTFVRVPVNVKKKIVTYDEIEETIYVYDEIIYDKDEYIEYLSANVTTLEKKLFNTVSLMNDIALSI